MSPPSRLRALVTSRRLPAVLGLLAVLLTLPALGVGYQADDWFHLAHIREPSLLGGAGSPALDMFTFMDGEPDRNRWMRDQGFLPWWAPLDLRAKLLRPLSAATHMLDDAVAPLRPVFAHAHSVAWFVLLVLLVHRLYRRLLPSAPAAGLAALMFAVDEAHGMPVGWIANRNALITGCFVVGVLLLHDARRRDGRRVGAWAAPLLYAAGLLAGEATISATAYLFAYALFVDRGTRSERLARLLPFAAITVGWRAAYGALGYGASGSGLYIDPVRTPLRYLAAAAERVPQLLADQFLGFPSMLPSFMDRGKGLALTVAVAIPLALLFRALARVLADSRPARFWATGTLLATLPVAATFPAPRLLTCVSLGGFALIAEAVARVRWSGTPPSPLARRVTSVALLLHLALAALALPATTWSPRALTDTLFNPCERMAPRGPGAERRIAVFINSNDLCAAYVPVVRAVRGEPSPRAFLLASALYDLEVEGVDPRTLELRIPAGMQSNPADSLLRSPDRPLAVGEVVEVPGVRFEILGHNGLGLVDRVRVRFEHALDDPRYAWLCTEGRSPAVCAPPAPGEVLRFRAAFGSI